MKNVLGYIGESLLTVEVFEDNTYSPGSADNRNSYNHLYTDSPQHPFKVVAVVLKDAEGTVLDSAVLVFSGFCGVGAGSFHATDSRILILAGMYLLSLDRATLQLLWRQQADSSCCFALRVVDDRVVVHGESQISCFGLDGEKLWDFFGHDIFATTTARECFTVQQDRIILYDFEDKRYEIDFSGNLLDSEMDFVKKVFVSCERIDSQYPQELIRSLVAHGFRVATSPRNPLDGPDPRWIDWYERGLIEQVSDADVFVALVTDSWDTATWMAQESEAAETFFRQTQRTRRCFVDLRSSDQMASGMKRYLKEELSSDIDLLLKELE